jgi:HAD superfamily hydrolase (TIGR01509 family)
LFLDFDGTIADTSGDVVCAVRRVLSEFKGKDYSDEEIVKNIWGPAERFLAHLLETPQNELPEGAASLFRKFYDENCNVHTAIYNGVENLLSEAAAGGKILAIATSKTRAPTLAILKKHGLLSFFHAVFADDDVKYSKPSPKCLLLPMERFQKTPEQTLFVGDTPVDIETGHHAGVDVAAALWGFGNAEELKKANPRYLVSSPRELKALL